MRKCLRITALVSLIALIDGCASVPFASQRATADAKSFATKPGLANIYIYRSESVGGAVTIPIFVDGVLLGKTAEETFAVVEVHPGKHKIVARAEKDATLDIVTTAGQNYFVWQEVTLGIRRARSQLHVMDEKEGKKRVKKYDLID